jgi:putative copper resistance protein D
VNLWFLTGGIEGLTATDYGHLLLLKLVLFIAMVGLATINRQSLLPDLSTHAENSHLGMRTARSLLRNAIIEIALGMIILGIVAMLGITPPAIEAHGHAH